MKKRTPRHHSKNHRSKGGENRQPRTGPEPSEPLFDQSRELGRMLAKGAAFEAGKRIADEATEQHIKALIDWIHSLFT